MSMSKLQLTAGWKKLFLVLSVANFVIIAGTVVLTVIAEAGCKDYGCTDLGFGLIPLFLLSLIAVVVLIVAVLAFLFKASAKKVGYFALVMAILTAGLLVFLMI